MTISLCLQNLVKKYAKHVTLFVNGTIFTLFPQCVYRHKIVDLTSVNPFVTIELLVQTFFMLCKTPIPYFWIDEY